MCLIRVHSPDMCIPAGGAEDLEDPVQGVGRAGAAGRLLPEPGGLVVPERAQCRAPYLRLPLERLHQPGTHAHCTVLNRHFFMMSMYYADP